ncbi:permease-like cell division protein FtsX [Nitrospina gracilis]|uniref:permease-like cell division protein FtsX n=1 Tax=Nitrospina gracilis TaxID=35801 RepID=UPI001EFFBFFC|nr:permease-like cell division protein FtsX [Nitrospina gracilis]MCF8720693.1 cell division transport system permease protein [Nitrospina gracilis Nb-211]
MIRSFRAALSNIKSNKQTCLASVGSITVALSIFSLFIFIYVNLNSLLTSWSNQVQLIVYLEDGISTERREKLEKFIKASPDVEGFKHVSRDEAWARFKEMFSDHAEFLGQMDLNPLPASYNIQFHASDRQFSAIKMFAERIRIKEGVESVEYGEKWIGRFETFMIFMKVFLIALGTLLSVGALLIISNTIKLSVFSRRDEIELMLLIGATPRFIKFPYLLEGALHGLLGAALSLALVKGLQIFLTLNFQGSLEVITRGMEFHFISPQFVGSIVACSVFLGWMGSYLSVNQFLKMFRSR